MVRSVDAHPMPSRKMRPDNLPRDRQALNGRNRQPRPARQVLNQRSSITVIQSQEPRTITAAVSVSDSVPASVG